LKQPQIACQKKPELIKGLNEYMKWRDDHMEAVAETKKSALAIHKIGGLINKITKKNKH
jgi:hypothetical protein